MSGVWGSHEVRGLPLGKVMQHFFFGTFKRSNMSSKAACETSNPGRDPKKIDSPNRLKICYFGPPGVSRGGLERPGPPGGGVRTLFGRILGSSGGALEPPWSVLGPSWGAPGASWAVLGAPWARLGASLGDLGRSWARLGALFGRLGRDCCESTKPKKLEENQGL